MKIKTLIFFSLMKIVSFSSVGFFSGRALPAYALSSRSVASIVALGAIGRLGYSLYKVSRYNNIPGITEGSGHSWNFWSKPNILQLEVNRLNFENENLRSENEDLRNKGLGDKLKEVFGNKFQNTAYSSNVPRVEKRNIVKGWSFPSLALWPATTRLNLEVKRLTLENRKLLSENEDLRNKGLRDKLKEVLDNPFSRINIANPSIYLMINCWNLTKSIGSNLKSSAKYVNDNVFPKVCSILGSSKDIVGLVCLYLLKSAKESVCPKLASMRAPIKRKIKIKWNAFRRFLDSHFHPDRDLSVVSPFPVE